MPISIYIYISMSTYIYIYIYIFHISIYIHLYLYLHLYLSLSLCIYIYYLYIYILSISIYIYAICKYIICIRTLCCIQVIHDHILYVWPVPPVLQEVLGSLRCWHSYGCYGPRSTMPQPWTKQTSAWPWASRVLRWRRALQICTSVLELYTESLRIFYMHSDFDILYVHIYIYI